MNLPDLEIIKLQYEILNVSIDSICAQSNVDKHFLMDCIETYNWKRWWNDPDEPETELTENEFGEDLLALKSEEYIDRTRKRLSAYALAKQVLLAQKYLMLESALIKKAVDLLDNIEVTSGNTKGIKELSALYKDLTKGSPLDSVIGLTAAADENGLPTLIIRDLAGGK